MDGQRDLRQERLVDLALALGMTPPEDGLDMQYDKCRWGWWLTGCKEGDCWMPRSNGAHTEEEALAAAEAWLAPELCKIRGEKWANQWK